MKRITAATLALGMLVGASAANAQSTPAQSHSRSLQGQGGAAHKEATRSAEPSGHSGFMLGAYALTAPGVTIEGTGDTDGKVETNFGAGAGIQVGYAFSPRFMLFSDLDVAKQGSTMDGAEGSFGLVHFDIGGRMSFPTTGQQLVPYVMAAIGGRAVGATVDDGIDSYKMSISGASFSAGGGMQYFLSPKLALDGGVSLGFGKFDKQKIRGHKEDLEVNNSLSTRVKMGVNWYP